MVHVSMMRQFKKKDACVHDTYSLHPDIRDSDAHCMLHLSMMLDPDACIYDAFIYVPRSLTMMHVCMMHISLILDLDLEACIYVWCMYL